MRLEKRIRALEVRMLSDPVILHFANGSTREIYGRGDYLIYVFAGVFGHRDLTEAEAADLALVRKCVFAQEPGGGHMVELINAVLGPLEEAGPRLSDYGNRKERCHVRILQEPPSQAT
jgi:hypothetical protein